MYNLRKWLRNRTSLSLSSDLYSCDKADFTDAVTEMAAQLLSSWFACRHTYVIHCVMGYIADIIVQR